MGLFLQFMNAVICSIRTISVSQIANSETQVKTETNGRLNRPFIHPLHAPVFIQYWSLHLAQLWPRHPYVPAHTIVPETRYSRTIGSPARKSRLATQPHSPALFFSFKIWTDRCTGTTNLGGFTEILGIDIWLIEHIQFEPPASIRHSIGRLTAPVHMYLYLNYSAHVPVTPVSDSTRATDAADGKWSEKWLKVV